MMKRAKLAPGSVPSGSLPTASCQTTPRCFVCDEPIKSHRLSTSLLAGCTQYTHSPLPTKIGGYIGDEFVVVVTPQDALCKHCMALINTMDRLEVELRQHRYTLTQHLKMKYKLDGCSSNQINNSKSVEEEDEYDEPEIIQVSDEEWTPNKRRRTEAVKHHRCTLCNASYTNLNLFMAHLSHHKQPDNAKVTNTSSSKSVGPVPMFKCGCCSESFPNKESLAAHMKVHTGSQSRSKLNQPVTPILSKEVVGSGSLHPPISVDTEAPPSSKDLEDLSQVSLSALGGVCSEEQRGRVCLLALLNNGVCSDLSHCISPEASTGDCTQVGSLSLSSNDLVVSTTVSSGSFPGREWLNEEHLSKSTSTCTSNVINSKTILHCEGDIILPHFGSPGNTSSICHAFGDTFCESSALCGKTEVNSNSTDCDKVSITEPSISWEKNIIGDSLTSCNTLSASLLASNRGAQSMPSLLDEDSVQLNGVSDENYVQTSSLGDNSREAKVSCLVEDADRTSKKGVELNEVIGNKETHLNTALLSTSNEISDPVKNIAIVSVTSVQMNGDNFDAVSLKNEWFYPSGKELSTTPETTILNEIESSLQSPWLLESNLSSAAGKSLFSETGNGEKYTMAQIVSDESKSADEQDSKSKISPLV